MYSIISSFCFSKSLQCEGDRSSAEHTHIDPLPSESLRHGNCVTKARARSICFGLVMDLVAEGLFRY